MIDKARLAGQYQLETQNAKNELERQTIDRAVALGQANSELERMIENRLRDLHVISRAAGDERSVRTAVEHTDPLTHSAGVLLITPGANDDLARAESLIETARLNALRKQHNADVKLRDDEIALVDARAELSRSATLLEQGIAGLGTAGEDNQRLAALGELTQINRELEARLTERAIEVEELNAALAQQLRDTERAYDDLESYAGALRTDEEQQRGHAQQLRALHAIASAASARGNEQIEAALRLGLTSLDLDFAYLGVIDWSDDELIIQESLSHDDDLLLSAGTRIPLDATIIGALISRKSRAVVIVDDAEKLDHPPLYSGWRASISVPLFIGDEAYGVIGFTARALRSERFSDANIEFIAVMGELVTSAVERRLKNAQLETSESRYRALTEALPQLVWVVDATGRLEYVNECWIQYTGRDLEQSRIAGVTAFYEDAGVVAAHQMSRDSSPTGFVYEARLRGADGSVRWHLIRAVPFAGAQIMAGKWIVTGTDIEDRKRSEAAVAEAHAAAVAATDSKSRFLATMSHEIRTPMNGVVGMTELLLLTPLTDEQHEYAQVVRDSGQSLLRVLNDILDYSKIEAGKVDIENIEFDLPAQIDSVVELLAAQFKAKYVSLTKQIGPDVPTNVIGDPGRVRQILLNLTGNALKFTPMGGRVEIHVTAGPVAEGKIPVHFIVRDWGIGIPAHVVDRLFMPFAQGDSSTTRRYGGTGLGLSICAQLVALMGGTIGVDSVDGSGSSFWFDVPFIKAGGALLKSDDRGNVLQRVPEPNGSRHEKILVVDDNEINVLLAAKQFERLGFTVTTVASGQLCLDALERDEFDLVFMDCQMPDMDGFATTQAIRSREIDSAERIPIVAMTADARAQDRERCLAVGMDDYISKPTSLGCLKEIVDRWLPALERRQTRRLAVPPPVANPSFGLAMLLDLFEGDRAAVSALLQTALGSIRADVVRIERAVVARNRKLVIEAAHRLKGASGSIRFVRSAEIAAAIGSAAATEPWNIAPALLISLREAVRSLDDEISRYLLRDDVVGSGSER